MNTELIINLATYFIIYSFLGWVIESIYKSIYEKKFINSGFLYGPFCPIYGLGAIIMYLSLKECTSNPIMVFAVGFLVLSIWEYLVGIFLEKIFHTKYWDYSNNKFNIHGRVCLLNSIFWGVLGLLFIEFIHPFIVSKLGLIDKNIILHADILIYMYLLTDVIVTVIKVKGIDVKFIKIDEIGESIKEKIEELKELAENSEYIIKSEKLQEAIKELKEKQEKLKYKLYKQTLRLKKAFPTMKSEKITEFLNQKIEFKRKKDK